MLCYPHGPSSPSLISPGDEIIFTFLLARGPDRGRGFRVRPTIFKSAESSPLRTARNCFKNVWSSGLLLLTEECNAIEMDFIVNMNGKCR